MNKSLAGRKAEVTGSISGIGPGKATSLAGADVMLLVEKQIRARAGAAGTTYKSARLELVSEKHSSKEIVTPGQLAAMAIFLCSPGTYQIRGQAYAIDGCWTAQ